ncbi:MAG: hypothetical protein LC127_00120 [Chitinophagales bacterium]|nr:hypothetical protein [Chitinophagales bacterium]
MKLNSRLLTKKAMLGSMVFVFLAAFALTLSARNHWHLKDIFNNKTEDKPPLSFIHQDTLPDSQSAVRIYKRTNDKDVKISIENGEVTDLEIDGKKIAKEDYDKYSDVIEGLTPKMESKGNTGMLFFDDNGNTGHFSFGFDDEMNMDSLFNYFGLSNQLNGFDFRSLQEQLKKLNDDSGTFHFNFGHLDSLDSIFRGFGNFGFSNNADDLNDSWNSRNDEPSTPSSGIVKPEDYKKILGDALNQDGFLIPNELNTVEITGKYLRINGEKQPNNIYQKYRRILEESSGIILQKNSKLKFDIEGKPSNKKYRTF